MEFKKRHSDRIDGKEHDKIRDRVKDSIDYKVSGIVVLRIENYNTIDIRRTIDIIKELGDWNERRELLGLKKIRLHSRIFKM